MTTPIGGGGGRDRTYELHFALTTDDYWNFNKYAYLRRTWGSGLVLVAMTTVLAWLYFTPLAQRGLLSVLIIPLLFVGTSGIVFIAAMSVQTRRQVDRAAEQSPGLFAPTTMTVDTDRISTRTAATESATAWTAFTKIEEDRERIYLFCTPTMAVIVPKRAFPDEERAREFFQFAQDTWATATSK